MIAQVAALIVVLQVVGTPVMQAAKVAVKEVAVLVAATTVKRPVIRPAKIDVVPKADIHKDDTRGQHCTLQEHNFYCN